MPGYIESYFTIPSGVEVEANGGGGEDTVTLSAGSYTLTSLCTALAAAFNTQLVSTGTWSVTPSTTTGLVTISVSSGTFSITWTSTALRDLLGFTATITTQTSVTGTNHARGLWIPECPANVDGDYLVAPLTTDLRTTESPTGLVLGIVGNAKYEHDNLRWPLVARNKVFVNGETTTHESWERFCRDTQWGQGHTWFTPASKCVVVFHDGNELGDGDVDGWYFKGIPSLKSSTRKVSEAWTGRWEVRVPQLVTDG